MDLAEILSSVQALDYDIGNMFIEASNSFDLLHYEDYIDALRLTFCNFTHETDGDKLQMLYTVLVEEINKVILQHGIVFMATVENDLRYLITFLDALTEIDSTEFIDTALTIVNGHYRAKETLSELLSLVSHKPADYFLTHLQSVDDTLISRIKEELNDRPNFHIEDHFETTPAHDIAIGLYKKLLEEYTKANIEFPLYTNRFLESAETIALPFNTYFDHYKENNVNKLISDDLKVELQVIFEVMGMICLSKESIIGFAGRIQNLTDYLYNDMGKRKRFSMNATTLLQRVSNG